MSASSKNSFDLKLVACQIAGVEYDPGKRISNGVPEALADYLCCSIDHARHILSGSKLPNRQMIKLLELKGVFNEP